MTELLALLGAHILADFYLQPSSWVLAKREEGGRSKPFYYHIGVVALSTYILLGILLGNWSNPLPAILLAVIHGIIDLIKIKFDTKEKNNARWFLADQALHLLSIVFTAGLLSGHMTQALSTLLNWYQQPRYLALTAGILLSLNPISFLVGIFTKPWRAELEALVPHLDDNLAHAGRWIGMTERLLIFIFVLIGQFSAIGFLIAAKSLLRFNDKASETIPSAYITKKSEYVLVGTLMSYTCAILLALVTKTFFKN
ncbi:DUF3307 domain-containing protein [Dyadobacter tibetensis]|uniref:DUF3307 domain-containing protein n=1 Tax=Dyadobacter tibetensis TaxID=1211851 RepID=UPI0004712109|nr:DUF3307 domain-containing protein [Dyadobacter tibetensis]